LLDSAFEVKLQRRAGEFRIFVTHCSQRVAEPVRSDGITIHLSSTPSSESPCDSWEHGFHRIEVPTKKSIETAAIWEGEILPRLLTIFRGALLSSDVTHVRLAWDKDQEAAVTAVLAVLIAFCDTRLSVHSSLDPDLCPVSKDAVKRMHAVLQQHVPTLPALSRRYMKHLNSFFSHPVHGWVLWTRELERARASTTSESCILTQLG
jgi:hypothetical protein